MLLLGLPRAGKSLQTITDAQCPHLLMKYLNVDKKHFFTGLTKRSNLPLSSIIPTVAGAMKAIERPKELSIGMNDCISKQGPIIRVNITNPSCRKEDVQNAKG